MTSKLMFWLVRKCNETCLMQNQNCFAQSIYIDGRWYLLAYVNGIQGMHWYQRIDWCWCDVEEDYECYTKRQVNSSIFKTLTPLGAFKNKMHSFSTFAWSCSPTEKETPNKVG